MHAAEAVRKIGFEPVPHLSARRLSNVGELDDYMTALAGKAEVRRIFVVAGDCAPLGPFEDALSIIRSEQIARFGIKQVGIAGYPDGHPDIARDQLWRALSEKAQALEDLGYSSEITTQFCFDVDAVVRWIEEVRSRDIWSTIRIGVPGPASVKSLLRFAARCGVGTSAKVMQKYGLSLGKLMSVTGPDRMLGEMQDRIDRSRHGDVRIHIYPFGGLERTAEWLTSFKPSI